jgi:serine/threonine protein kinase
LAWQRQAEKDEELLDQLPGQFSKSLSREVRLLQSLHHPNIIRLYQVVETEQEYYIITYVLISPLAAPLLFLDAPLLEPARGGNDCG